MLRKWNKFKWHRDRGIHNEIPLCCTIWFFVRSEIHWSWVVGHCKLAYKNWKRNKCNYVRCPICAIRRIDFEVHECVPTCGIYFKERAR